MNDGLTKSTEKMDLAYAKADRMRYEKNKTCSNLALLAILFNALFFISIYKSDVGTWYYTYLIGISVVYNLFFMMIVFLISEGSKNYKIQYSWVAIVVGVLQFARLLGYPRLAHGAQTQAMGETVRVMGDAQYLRVVIYLILSGTCLIASAALGIWKSTVLTKHLKAISAVK